jgi:hypothetical protein
MDIMPAVRNVSSKETLGENFLAFRLRLIDIVLLEDDLILFAFLLVRVDNIVVILVKLVEGFVDLGSKAMVTANSLSDSLVLLSILLIQNDEDKIETREKGVRHTDVLSGGHLSLILSVDGVSSCDD